MGLMDDMYDWARKFPQRIDEVDYLLTENRIWIQRTKDIGIVSAEDALNYGFRSVLQSQCSFKPPIAERSISARDAAL